jgi:hypothetical protein
MLGSRAAIGRTLIDAGGIFQGHVNYNQLHPHRALGYRSPREFIADRSIKEAVEPVSGN